MIRFFLLRIISIHAAREGGDGRGAGLHFRGCTFQSTPPVKAATSSRGRIARAQGFQSTPPVKAATAGKQAVLAQPRISIHAAREGGDDAAAVSYQPVSNFNPRRP